MRFLLSTVIGRFILKYLLLKRVVMAVDVEGSEYIAILKYTQSGKAYLGLDRGLVGFLDNPKQKEGEFRKNVSSQTLVRWFYI